MVEAAQSNPRDPNVTKSGDGGEFSDVGPPDLPSFWAEMSRKIAGKWPVPVFFAGLAALLLYLWARPRGEKLRPWEDYLADADRAFSMAVVAQDERADVQRALLFLAGRDVNELAIARWREQEEADRDGGPLLAVPAELNRRLMREFDEVGAVSEEMVPVRKADRWGFVDTYGRPAAGFFSRTGRRLTRPRFEGVVRFFNELALVREDGKWLFVDRAGRPVEPGGVHGVLPSYDRVVTQAGEAALGADDLARIGESLYRLGRIKRNHAKGAGRSVNASAGVLFMRAAQRLDAAWDQVRREASEARSKAAGRQPVEEDRRKAEALAAAMESSAWRRRRRMWAECQVHLGNYDRAVNELRELIAKMNAAESKELRIQKDPSGTPGGIEGGNGASGRDSQEWARVYELMARCYGHKKDYAEAARYYRLFLEQGPGGLLAHQARVRLAELIMDQSVSEDEDSRAIEGFAEVASLCSRVEESDAPTHLREDATFLRGRAWYRSGQLLGATPAGRAAFKKAAGAFRYNYSPSRSYLDMSRVLLARALFFGGEESGREEAVEILEGIIRVGAPPAIYACTEVSRADMYPEDDPAKAVGGRVESKRIITRIDLVEGKTAGEVLGLRVKDLSGDGAAALGLERGGALVVDVAMDGPAQQAGVREDDVIVTFGKREVVDAGDVLQVAEERAAEITPASRLSIGVVLVRPNQERGLTHGYIDAIRRIRRLSKSDRKGLVPELAALLEDGHFVLQSPRPGQDLPAGRAQLLRIARTYSTLHEFDEAARIYLHILRAYPEVARDSYSFLLGELYAAKALRLGRDRRKDKERKRALLASARAFMRVNLETPTSRFAADAYWQAGKKYFEAGYYGGASRALDEFNTRFGDDPRLSEGLYLQGESMRRMGDGSSAARVFTRCSVEHRSDQFGYLSHLALGETYLEMGRMGPAAAEKGEAANRNALAVFQAIRRDARYTPDSLVWMKALFLLGETRYRLGRRDLIRVQEMQRSAELGRELREARASLAKIKEQKRPEEEVAAAEQVVRDLEANAPNPVVEEARALLEKIRKEGADEGDIVREEERIALLEQAALNPATVSRTASQAQAHFKSAAQHLEEAMERYPLSRYGSDRSPSFHSFIKERSLPAKRALAMAYYHMGESAKAHALFRKILEETGKAGVSERARAEGFRRDAYMFKGIIELGRAMSANSPKDYRAARDTFQKAFDEFARTADGPWFCLASGMALEGIRDVTEARRKYERALEGYRTLKGKTSRDEWTGIRESKALILAIDRWIKHGKWVSETL